ncbi:C2 calcium-dependent domain-containing protein 4A [Heptranchias perlo]|uniref:C2 calcium-dependent domain-containing protein 4A n=1 Tax=Heptranchias perlo TaxID=212740 RepID=UPI003559EFA5
MSPDPNPARRTMVYTNVLTPDRIPEFFIPPKFVPQQSPGAAPCQRTSTVNPPAGEKPLWERCIVDLECRGYQGRGLVMARGHTEGDSTDWDPKSQAALSLPHFPRALTPYGFCTLLESPHTRRKESLFHGHPSAPRGIPVGKPPPSAHLTPPSAHLTPPSAHLTPPSARLSPSTHLTSPSTRLSPSAHLTPPSAHLTPPSTRPSPSVHRPSPSAWLSPSTWLSPSAHLTPLSTRLPPSAHLTPPSARLSPSAHLTPPSARLSPSAHLTSPSTRLSPSAHLTSPSTRLSPSAHLTPLSTRLPPSAHLTPPSAHLTLPSAHQPSPSVRRSPSTRPSPSAHRPSPSAWLSAPGLLSSEPSSSQESSPPSRPRLPRAPNSCSLLRALGWRNALGRTARKWPGVRPRRDSSLSSSTDSSPDPGRRAHSAPSSPGFVPLGQSLVKESIATLGESGVLRLRAEYCSERQRIRLQLLSLEGLYEQCADCQSICCRLSLYLEPGKAQKQQSVIIRRSRNPIFNQDFFFDGISGDQLDSKYFKIKVINKVSSVKRDSVLGVYKLCLASILPL